MYIRINLHFKILYCTVFTNGDGYLFCFIADEFRARETSGVPERKVIDIRNLSFLGKSKHFLSLLLPDQETMISYL